MISCISTGSSPPLCHPSGLFPPDMRVHSPLYRRNIIVVKQLIYNDISSTKVRLFVKRGMSIKCVFPAATHVHVSYSQMGTLVLLGSFYRTR